jgi:NADH-quinone oxidoreductase subunit L
MIILFSSLFGFLLNRICELFKLPSKYGIFFSVSFGALCYISSVFFHFYDFPECKENFYVEIFSWFKSTNLNINFGFFVDKISEPMILMTSFLSFMILIYSIHYMHNDPRRNLFLSYINLFTFFMLFCITSDNFIQMFFGWEGMGVLSFLMVTFWTTKENVSKYGYRIMIINRFGDAALISGIVMIFINTKSLNFDSVFKMIDMSNDCEYNLLGFLIFVGCMTKSAQIFFHGWLPLAMLGPTPGSALIHAATMVTAGVFLIIRLSPIFECTIVIKDIMLWVGALTALLGSLAACGQDKLKGIVAYSTCSQLGLMIMACGAGAYEASMQHLIVHGYFKALLFLCAGAVIECLQNEGYITNMGNLFKPLFRIYACMLIATLNLAGFPFTSGGGSKHAILASVQNNIVFWIAIFSSLATVFYSFRMMFLVFHGAKNRTDEHIIARIHNPSFVMLIPMILVTVFTFKQSYDFGLHLKLHNDIILYSGSILSCLFSYFLYKDGPRKTLNILKNEFYINKLYDFIGFLYSSFANAFLLIESFFNFLFFSITSVILSKSAILFDRVHRIGIPAMLICFALLLRIML